MIRLAPMLSGLMVMLALVVSPVRAQTEAPASANSEAIFSVARDGYSMAGLLSHRRDVAKIRYGIALFAGHPGILRLREEAGQPAFDLRGNFLVRSRRHWLDDETLVIVIDAPSDQWLGFSQHFRETTRYGEDVAALLRAAGTQFGVTEWTAVGTSEGSVSAFHAARMNPKLINWLILSASVFLPSRNGPGLSWVAWEELKMPLLWVHHVDDPCKFTPYRLAEDLAAKTKSPLISVRGTEGWRGNACDAFTGHGFVGVEVETVQAMRIWMKTGVAVKEVAH